jgi:hypothetical protein
MNQFTHIHFHPPSQVLLQKLIDYNLFRPDGWTYLKGVVAICLDVWSRVRDPRRLWLCNWKLQGRGIRRMVRFAVSRTGVVLGISSLGEEVVGVPRIPCDDVTPPLVGLCHPLSGCCA